MPRVSQHYKLGAGPFEFLDVQVQKDNLLFLDPSAIRRGTDRYSKRADRLLVGFFAEVLRCARSTSRADQTKGLQMLQALHEPNETRLGFSSRGLRGHGFGDGMGKELWDAIVANKAAHSVVKPGGSSTIRQAVMSRLEDVPLFIERVDRDMISDLATRVAFDVLADFTNDMMAKYANLAASSRKHDAEVWDGSSRGMVSQQYDLPFVSGHALLLVPRPWVEKRLIMNATAFYNRQATQVLQDETARTMQNGKVSKQTKRSIKALHADVKRTNTTQAVRYAETHSRDLVGEYRSWTDANVDRISDSEVDRRLR